MIDAKVQAGSAAAGALSAVLGFAAPWPMVVTGLFFAAAGGFAGMVVSPPMERLGLPVTIIVALVIGGFAGMLHPHVDWISFLPVQLVMGVAGLCSRPIARRAVSGDLPFLRRIVK